MINYAFSMADLEYYLLILCRVSGLIHTAPFYGTQGSPMRIRIGLSLMVSYLLYLVLPGEADIVYKTTTGWALMVIKELVCGLIMGYACNICMTIVTFTGRIIDMEVGLSMASIFDPATNESVSITGALYQYALILMLFATGMYQYILKALVESFALIPVNGANFPPDRLMTAVLQFLTDYIFLGFRICLPVFCVMIILNAVLGVLAKVAPQMNMFAVGFQLKVMLGLSILFLTAGLLPSISELIFTEMKTVMVSFVEAMM